MKLKLKITEVRVCEIEVDTDMYPEDQRDVNSILEIERDNIAENAWFMDDLDASSEVSIKALEAKAVIDE